jgi:hypothetical protein
MYALLESLYAKTWSSRVTTEVGSAIEIGIVLSAARRRLKQPTPLDNEMNKNRKTRLLLLRHQELNGNDCDEKMSSRIDKHYIPSFFHLDDGKNASFVAFVVDAMYLNAPRVVLVWLRCGDFGVCLAMVAPSCRLRREITHQRYPLWSSQAAWSNALTRLSRRLLITMTATDPESEVGMQFLSIFWLICRSKSAIRAYSDGSIVLPKWREVINHS